MTGTKQNVQISEKNGLKLVNLLHYNNRKLLIRDSNTSSFLLLLEYRSINHTSSCIGRSSFASTILILTRMYT